MSHTGHEQPQSVRLTSATGHIKAARCSGMSTLEEVRALRNELHVSRRRAAGADAQAEAALSAHRHRTLPADPGLTRRRELAEAVRVARQEVDTAFTHGPHSHARAHSAATAHTRSHKPSVEAALITCNICTHESSENYALVPCGHCNFCKTCVDKMDKCPYGCPKLTQRMKLFY